MTCISCFFGIQPICLGVIGEYVGKIYMEVKHWPRYSISERVGEFDGGSEGIKDACRRAFPGEEETVE